MSALIKDWVNLCDRMKIFLKPACDVATSYYAWTRDVTIVGIRGFYLYNHKGERKYGDRISIDLDNIIVCHFMSREDMNEYHMIRDMSPITKKYTSAASKPSDIWEHLPTLREYASRCNTIAEMGVRHAVSTWAFLEGLREREGDRKLYCVDISNVPSMPEVIRMAKNDGIVVEFMKEDSAKVDLPKEDLLFIDTWHVYGHLKRELTKHHSITGKYIIMHDTTVDADIGESIRLRINVNRQSEKSGYPRE